MLFSLYLASLILLSIYLPTNAVQIRDSPVTLSLARRLNPDSLRDFVRRDFERVNALRQNGLNGLASEDHTEDVINNGVAYIASIGVGSPPTNYDLIVDTGSSNTWVGAGKKYIPTSTSVKTGDTVAVRYGSGFFSGNEYIDRVTITNGLVIANQSIGVATNSSQFQDVDGIIGIGPQGLTLRTLNPSRGTTIPTVTDNAFAQGLINSDQIGIYFEPYTNASQIGEISWGCPNPSRYTGEITYAPVTSIRNASRYWGIDQTVRYGASNVLLQSAGIVDTGSTLLYLATDAYDLYRNVTGAIFDSETGLLRITPSQYTKIESLFFTIAGVDFELTPNAQLWPRALNTAIGGSNDFLYLIVTDLKVHSGSGMDFINGYAFLERYYTVYDTTNQKVGFAMTAHTFAETN